MEKQLIKLNFLPLVNSSFDFTIFSKIYEDPKPEDLYRAKLPKKNDKDTGKDYLINFTKFKEGKEQIISSHLNQIITTKFIFYNIEKICKEFFSDKILPPKNKFDKKIYFILKEHSEGYETIWIRPYYLKNEKQFGLLVDFHFRCHKNNSFNKKIQNLSLSLDKNFRSNKNFYIDKYKKVEYFLSKYFDKLLEHLPHQLKLSKNFEILDPNLLNVKKYVFANRNTYNSQFIGIQKFGPCASPNSPLHIPILYEKQMIYFAKELKESLEGKSFPTFRSFKEVFKIQEKIYMNQSDSLNKDNTSFIELVNRIKKFKNSNNSVVPIMILESNEDQRYFDLKHFMLKNNLPFQVVTKKLIANKTSLKWSISNIALQIFSKSGGIPWKVTPSNENCFIFGLGQAHHRKEKKIIKYFSYLVCTDSSGIYKKVDVLGMSNTEGDYLDQLKDNIIKIVKRTKEKSIKKIVFHVPFRIKKNELNKIYEGLKSIKETNDLDLIVIRVNEKNDFFGYANNNSLVPLESSFLSLSNTEYLIWFEGMQFHNKNILKMIPGPIFIEFLWTNRDLLPSEKKNCLQDLLNLSGTNWRGFNSKNVPISIYYCKKISEFLANFQKEVHNIDNIPEPWFL